MTVRHPAGGDGQVAATATASHLPELGCFVVVFADDPEDIRWSLEFAVADEHDEQDRELGQDTYSVTVNGGATVYGGVLRWAVSDATVSVVFRPEAAQVLGLPEEIRLALDRDGAELRSVHQGLERILGPWD